MDNTIPPVKNNQGVLSKISLWLTNSNTKPISKFDLIREIVNDAEKYDNLSDKETSQLMLERVKLLCDQN